MRANLHGFPSRHSTVSGLAFATSTAIGHVVVLVVSVCVVLVVAVVMVTVVEVKIYSDY